MSNKHTGIGMLAGAITFVYAWQGIEQFGISVMYVFMGAVILLELIESI